MEFKKIEEMIGRTFTDVKQVDKETIVFRKDVPGGYTTFEFYHIQDCCENVSIEDVCGDLRDLEFSPILTAEVCTKQDDTVCGTWTFYRFQTVKGTVTIRWYGESNGYYSEEVSIMKTEVRESLLMPA